MGNKNISMPLIPAKIRVRPDPSLHVHYFWQRYVEGDNPFTTDVREPSVPFSLGVVIKNAGYGTAYKVHFSSDESEIVENKRGLAVDFKLIGSSLGAAPREPNLNNVKIGEIAPNETAVVRWWMVSSLRGHFQNYSATFTNTNPLGDEKLSLLDELKIHELIQNVRVYGGDDDNILDFLVNDKPDLAAVPDGLYDSRNLSYYPVGTGRVIEDLSTIGRLAAVCEGEQTPENDDCEVSVDYRTYAFTSMIVYATPQDEPGILVVSLVVSSNATSWNYFVLDGNMGTRFGLTEGMKVRPVLHFVGLAWI